jgi:hypothetical protein
MFLPNGAFAERRFCGAAFLRSGTFVERRFCGTAIGRMSLTPGSKSPDEAPRRSLGFHFFKPEAIQSIGSVWQKKK